jgi:hypothetical protein
MNLLVQWFLPIILGGWNLFMMLFIIRNGFRGIIETRTLARSKANEAKMLQAMKTEYR